MENSTLQNEECFQNFYVISSSALIPAITFSIISGVAAVMLNILVILAIYTNSSLRSTTNYGVTSLAIADLLLGLMGVPVWCLKLLHKAGIIKPDVHNLFTCILVLTLSSSSLNLLALSYDRFVGVTSPLQYASRITPKRCGQAMAAIWVVSSLAAIATLASKCSVRPQGHFLLITGIFGVPLIFIGYFYCRIFKEARRQKRLIKLQEASTYQPCFLKQNKAAITVALVIGSFGLCWLPSLIDAVIHLLAPRLWRQTQLYLGTTTLACFSSMMNPIVYSVRNKAFRDTFRNFFKWTKVSRRISMSVIFNS